jgi:hypothetical protein
LKLIKYISSKKIEKNKNKHKKAIKIINEIIETHGNYKGYKIDINGTHRKGDTLLGTAVLFEKFDIVKLFNNSTLTKRVTKVLNIATDSTNIKCLYLTETIDFTPASNSDGDNSSKINSVLVLPYKYSSNKFAYIPDDNSMSIHNVNPINNTFSPALGFNYTPAVRDTDFSIADNNLLSEPEVYTEVPSSGSTNLNDKFNISRTYNKAGTFTYTCNHPDIKARLIRQFNNKNKGILNFKEKFFQFKSKLK